MEPQCRELVRLLKVGPLTAGVATGLWALPHISRSTEKRSSVSMMAPSLWRLLGRLGWSVQQPGGQARECDERPMCNSTAKSWLALEKSLRGKVE